MTTPHVPGNRLLVTWNVINKSIEVSKKLDQMRAKYCIDESRIYFAGHSVDAAATYKLAVTRTTRPAAGVAMSGRDRQTNDMFSPDSTPFGNPVTTTSWRNCEPEQGDDARFDLTFHMSQGGVHTIAFCDNFWRQLITQLFGYTLPPQELEEGE